MEDTRQVEVLAQQAAQLPTGSGERERLEAEIAQRIAAIRAENPHAFTTPVGLGRRPFTVAEIIRAHAVPC